MKIIANTASGVLIEASHGEVNRLANRTLYKTNMYGSLESPSLGTVFDINMMVEQLRHNATRSHEIELVRKTLTGVLAHLSLIEPYLNEPSASTEAEAQPLQQH